MDTVGAVVPITITGQNFAEQPDSNLVYFGGRRGYVHEATANELVVYAPDVANPSDMPLKLTTLGARFFSDELPYRVVPAAQAYGGLSDREVPYAIATADDGSVLVNLPDAAPSGVYRLTPSGEKVLFAENGFSWSAFEMGPAGGLFGVRNVRAVFRFPPEGGPREVWLAIDGGGSLTALDIDEDGNVWTGGRSPAIYRITQDKELAEFPFEHQVRAVERYEDDLFALVAEEQEDPGTGTATTSTVLWRFPINVGATLGAGERVFQLTDATGGAQGLALAAAEGGTLFIGTNGGDPLLLWHPDGSYETLYPQAAPNPDVAGLERDARFLAWGKGPHLYYAQGGTVVGSDLTDYSPQLMRINTLTYRSAE